MPDESEMYFQVSFSNGFFAHDVAADKVTRMKTPPPATTAPPSRKVR